MLALSGLSLPLQRSASLVHDHAVSALSLWLTGLVVSAVEPKHLSVIAAALVFDAALLFVEGWALYKAWWWGAWLVVFASGALVPFEVVAFAQHPAAGRALLVLLNATIVGWRCATLCVAGQSREMGRFCIDVPQAHALSGCGRRSGKILVRRSGAPSARSHQSPARRSLRTRCGPPRCPRAGFADRRSQRG
jgi:uncharacterized membrane protein (DUF2068 family)